MEPNNRNYGDPFGRGGANYNYDPAQLQGPRSLAGQAFPLLQPQGGHVVAVGENPPSAGFLRDGNIQGYDHHMLGMPCAHFSRAPQRPSTPIFNNNNQYQASGSGPQAQHGSAALFHAHGGGDVAGHAAPYPTTVGPYASTHLLAAPPSNQPDPVPSFFNQLPSAAHWQSVPSSSGGQHHPSTYFPQPGAGTRTGFFSAWGDNAIQGQAGYQLPRSRAPSIEEVRDLLLNSPPNTSLVTKPEISKQAVFLLDHGDQEVRRKVLISVMLDVHMVMRSDAGAEVFVALLRAAERAEQVAELSDIVHAAASPNHARFFLTSVAGHVFRDAALRELFRVAARDPRLHEPLGACLIDKWMVERLGPDLLHYLFTTLDLPYIYCSIFIRQLAIPRFREIVTSELGWTCLVECLISARGDELTNLEQTILECTFAISKNQYGSRFLQEIIKGDYHLYRFELRNGIRTQVLMNLAQFSMDKYGHYLVQACFASPTHRTELLDAFGNQPFDEFYRLVRDLHASHVIRNLLKAVEHAIHPAVRKKAVKLARRIQGLKRLFGQNAIYEEVKMMPVVERVLAWAGPED